MTSLSRGHVGATTEIDVLIVGAGPTGLVLALLLAGRGIRVSVYERWMAPYPLPRAISLTHETVRVVQATGHFGTLRPSLDVEVSRQVEPVYLAANGEVLFRHPLDGDGFSFYPPMVLFDQPSFESALNKACANEPLISLNRGWNICALSESGDIARVQVEPFEDGDVRPGGRVDVSAKYVVGCDGANSTIRSLLNLDMVDTGFSEPWLVVDLELEPDVHASIPFGQLLDPKRPTSMLVSAHGKRRFEFMMLEGEGPEMADEANVWRLIKQWGCTPENTHIVRSATYTFRGRWANPWRKGRFLLAGDAAHQMPPFMGQGLNSGLRDAVALAWRLDLIFKGADIRLLESYTSERLPHVREIVHQAVTLGKIICTLDPAQAAERDDFFRRAQKDPSLMAKMASGAVAQDIDASPDDETFELVPPDRLGAGLRREGDAYAGYLTIQGRLARGAVTALFDDIVGPGRFVLFSRADLGVTLSKEASDILEAIGGTALSLDDVEDVDGTYRRWLDHLGVEAVLIRPDFYSFGTAKRSDDVNALVLDLAQQLRFPQAAVAD